MQMAEPKVSALSQDDDANANMSGILNVGQVIRPPEMTPEHVTKLVEQLYDLRVTDVKELISYDDKNFVIEAKNPGSSSCVSKFTLKVTNSLDSQNPGFIDGQNQALLHAHRNGIAVPVPVANVQGRLHSMELLDFSDPSPRNTRDDAPRYAVRLLTFLPGETAAKVPFTERFLHQWGHTLGVFHNAFQDFRNEPLEGRRTIWSLFNVPKLKNFFFAINDPHKRNLVEDGVQKFIDSGVLEKKDSLPGGIIHSDCNEQNILVRQSSDPNEYDICGLLDFGDMHGAPYVFDLAIAIAYAIIECHTLNPRYLAGGHVLAGYLSARTISETEFKLLPVIVSARICQSLVMGAYTYSLDPSNYYVLASAKNGWTALELLHTIPSDDLCRLWDDIVRNYGNYQGSLMDE